MAVKILATRSLALAFIGKSLTIFGLGAWFSVELEVIRNIIFFLSAALLAQSGLSNLLDWHKQRKQLYVNYLFYAWGLFGLFLAVGGLFPKLPFKLVIIAAGIILVLPAIKDLFRRKKIN